MSIMHHEPLSLRIHRSFAAVSGVAIVVAGALALFAGCRKAETPAPEAKPVEVAAPKPVADELPPKSEWKATASAMQEDIYPAQLACDGDTSTRWSSPATDPQWLKIDMGRVATVSGFTIRWETAFSSDYVIELSSDDKNWTAAFRQPKGDGNTDEIYIRPTPARFVRITGNKRGTGWGHSIWELDIKGLSEAVIVQADAAQGSDPQNAMDGRLDTVWTSAKPGPATLTADLRKPKAFGGIRVDWGDGYALSFVLSVSQDGAAWSKVAELTDGTGVFDLSLIPQVTAQFLRLEMTPAGEGPIQVKELTLRGSDELLTDLALYQIAAEKAKPGVYPEQFRQRQVYWTLAGLPGDGEESALDEYGNFEPKAGSFTVMPYLYVNGTLRSALDAKGLVQALEGDTFPMPSVTWESDDLSLSVHAVTCGSIGDSATFVRYRVTNTSAAPVAGRLFLAVRPVQISPTWQHGGLSRIRSLIFEGGTNSSVVRVNGDPTLVALQAPDAAGARHFERGDVAQELVRGELPPERGLSATGDLISGAMAYDFNLAPGESKIVVLAAPLYGKMGVVDNFTRRGYGEPVSPAEAFDLRWSEMRSFWKEQYGKVVIELPDKAVSDTMKSQVGYILVNRDGVAIQPGSRNYKRSWMRDGSLTSAGLLRMGMTKVVRDYLNWYADRVQPDGWVPPILESDGRINQGFGWDNEYDSQGQFIFAIMEYYRFTGDREFLEKHFDAVHRAMKYMAMLREKTLSPDHMKDEPARERFVGILPASISHEGYSPAMHSYWDDFFALKGWKDGREAAEVLGRHDIVQWAEEQHKLLQDGVKASIEATIAFKKIPYVPGCAEKGDMDATSTTIAFFPCEEDGILPQDALRETYDMYYNDVRRRLDPSWSAGYTPYEIRNIAAFLGLGQQDRAGFLLDYIMSCRRPPAWNHLAEVVLSDPRMGSYIGDMPHTWVGSGFINSVRGMLVREMGGKLHLLRGAREDWVRKGDGILVENLPTYFGTLNMKARAEGNSLRVTLGGEFKAPNGTVLHWPLPGKPAKVTINGMEYTNYDETVCRFGGMLKGEIVAEW